MAVVEMHSMSSTRVVFCVIRDCLEEEEEEEEVEEEMEEGFKEERFFCFWTMPEDFFRPVLSEMG